MDDTSSTSETITVTRTNNHDNVLATAETVTISSHLVRDGRITTVTTQRRSSVVKKLSSIHQKIPYPRRLPLAAILIIIFLILMILVAWAICALVHTRYHTLLGTAALAYSLGLRYALDVDHISAIDLMIRRLIASGQQPVTVGTFFSLGHSTIVIVTSTVVATTAAGISDRFGGFEKIGSIIGTSVSTAFLILLGIMNAHILYKLLV